MEVPSGITSAIVLGVLLILSFRNQLRRKKTSTRSPSSHSNVDLANVKPVRSDFLWENEPPLKSYPFKGTEYKLTMGIRRIPIEDWLLIEDTYLKNINEKVKITTNTHPAYPKDRDLQGSTVFSLPEAVPAIREFYDIVIQYMCNKYPMCFERLPNSLVRNKITNKLIPEFSSHSTDAKDLLHILVETIEEDFIVMMKDDSKPEDSPHGSEYYFKGGVFAFAAGFDPKDKLDKPLTLIHEPIPGYEKKLKLSMNRFFDKLQPGDLVTRSNFSVQTHDKYYVDDLNKGYHLTDEELNTPIPYEDLDFDKQVHYRSERQVLLRLPKTNAIIFTIRTYMHPMNRFKKDKENAVKLRNTVEHFPEDLGKYKSLIRIKSAVIQYLDEILA